MKYNYKLKQQACSSCYITTECLLGLLVCLIHGHALLGLELGEAEAGALSEFHELLRALRNALRLGVLKLLAGERAIPAHSNALIEAACHESIVHSISSHTNKHTNTSITLVDPNISKNLTDAYLKESFICCSSRNFMNSGFW
jgi:hypothetical protein